MSTSVIVPCRSCHTQGVLNGEKCNKCKGYAYLLEETRQCERCYGEQPEVRWVGKTPETIECELCKNLKWVTTVRPFEEPPRAVSVEEVMDALSALAAEGIEQSSFDDVTLIDEAIQEAVDTTVELVKTAEFSDYESWVAGTAIGLLIHASQQQDQRVPVGEMLTNLEDGQIVMTAAEIWHVHPERGGTILASFS